MYQHLRSTHDVNGNPRRLWVEYNAGGGIVGVWVEGYSSLPAELRGKIELPSIDISPAEYRRFVAMGKLGHCLKYCN
jgi:hypothetical protein